MMTRKTQYAWMAVGAMLCLLGIGLALKMRDTEQGRRPKRHGLRPARSDRHREKDRAGLRPSRRRSRQCRPRRRRPAFVPAPPRLRVIPEDKSQAATPHRSRRLHRRPFSFTEGPITGQPTPPPPIPAPPPPPPVVVAPPPAPGPE